MRRELLLHLALLASAAAASCDAGAPQSPAAQARALRDVHRLRVLGKLHAERDTLEGYRDAAAYLRRVVELEPGSASDHLHLAKALLFGGDLSGCELELAGARRLFAGNGEPPDLDYAAGLLERRRGSDAQALDAFRRVIERRPDHWPSWFQRAGVEERLGRLEEAEKSLRTVLRLEKTLAPAAYRLAMVLRRLGREAEAKEMLDLFRTLPDPSTFETEKCDLTQVSLRPCGRRDAEPAFVNLSFADATGRLLGKEAARGMAGARSLPFGAEGSRALILAGPAGARVLKRMGQRLEPASSALPEGGGPRTALLLDAIPADVDNDAVCDLISIERGAVRLLRGRPDGSFAASPAPLLEDAAGGVRAAAVHDADHDGDLDLIVLLAAGDRLAAPLLRNDGDGTFARLEPFGEIAARAGPQSAPRAAISAHDVDQANDIDFAFAAGEAGIQVFLNRRDGGFTRTPLASLGKRTMVIVEDLNNDGAPDFFAAGGEPGWSAAANADPLGSPYSLRTAEPAAAQTARAGEVRDACAADLDNDGDLDVLLAAAHGVALLRNAEGGSLREEDAVPLEAGPGATSVAAADLDEDGALEVLAGGDGGNLTVFSTSPTPRYASLELRCVGSRDNVNGIGAVVEVFSGRLYQSLLVREAAGLHLGLGAAGRDELDGLRIRWPQGIVQAAPAAEIHPDARGAVKIAQKEGLVASCPFLYARSGSGWLFLTDVLGIAPLDEWLPPGQPPRIDPEEIVRIDGEALAARDGALRIAITEELRETAYLDRVQLIAVEHPADLEVFTDESTREPAYGPVRLAVVRREDLSPPSSLRLEGGADVAPLARTRDRAYVRGYREARPQWAGWVERYGLDLVTPRPARALLLEGRVAWYDSTVAYAVAQSGRTWGPLRLECVLPDGGLLVRCEDLGLPAGMDRTMVVPFPSALEAGSRLRLTSQHRLLWDQVLFADNLEELELPPGDGSLPLARGGSIGHRRLEARRAVLGFHGFSRAAGDCARHEQTYVYGDAQPGDAFSPAAGRATRYGDVTPLLRAHEDELVVLASGDGIEIDFDAPTRPGPARTLTYFLRVSGWAKEASFHNPTGRSIEPLPFRAMRSYPPAPGEVRGDAAYRAYLETYQTREVRRRAP